MGRPLEITRTGYTSAELRRLSGGCHDGALVGSRPHMVRDNRHTSTYLFGATRPDPAIGAAMIAPCANSWAMGLHLEEISAQISEVAPAVHTVWRLG